MMSHENVRVAIVRGDGTLECAKAQLPRVKALLPDDYDAAIALDVRHGMGYVAVWIRGVDVAGWTMEDYVLPRLASGLLWAEEAHR